MFTFVVVAAVVAAAPPAVGVEAAEVLVEVGGATPGWQASFDVKGGADDVFAVLADVEGAGKVIFPSVKSVKQVARRSAQTRELEYVVNGGMSDMSYMTTNTVTPNKDGGGSATWHRLSGDFDVLDGSWVVTPLPTPGWCHVVYVSRVALGPGFMQGLVRGGVHDALVGIGARVRSQVAVAAKKKPTDPPAASESLTPAPTSAASTTTP